MGLLNLFILSGTHWDLRGLLRKVHRAGQSKAVAVAVVAFVAVEVALVKHELHPQQHWLAGIHQVRKYR